MGRVGRRGRMTFVAAGMATVCCAALLMATPAQAATPIHVNCDGGGNLQNKIDAAASGATILIKGTCGGQFTVTGKGLRLRGNPRATLDGQATGTVLSVDSAGRSVTLVDLTVRGGEATTEGGGIYVHDGTLHLVRTTVRGNRALGTANSYGGGIALEGSGSLTLTSSRVTGNRALTEPAAGYAYAYGGGIYTNKSVTLTDSTVQGNVARATSADMFAYAYGGGLDAGAVTLTGSVLKGNVARATGHGQFAYAYGGGGQVSELTATRSTIAGNGSVAASDTDFTYAYGGGVDAGSATLTLSNVTGNRASSTAGDFAQAYGGGVNLGEQLVMDRSSVEDNRATSESSGSYATAVGGGIDGSLSPVVLRRSTVGRNTVGATAPSDDATAAGGGIMSSGPVSVTNSTIAANLVASEAGPGAGDTGTSSGGGVNSASGKLVNATVAANQVTGSGNAHTETGGGLDVGPLNTKASILAGNTATTGPDCSATATTSQGFNLVQHTDGCLPSPAASDVTGKPAKLGMLKANGGPTQTKAIPATSPAFNAIPNGACAVKVDQRGVHRPQGPRCDIGAYERKV